MPTPLPDIGTAKATKRIEDWKQKLVDLTRRNRLLFFRTTKSSTLKLLEPGLNDIFTRLLADGKGWQFFFPPDDPNENELVGTIPDTELHAPMQSQSGYEVNENSIHQHDREANPPVPSISLDRARQLRNPDELICNIREPKRLRSILRNLYRRSKADFEERGVRILYVAFGILQWQETQETEYSESPILLVPVQIKQASVNDPYILTFAEEEIVINPALEVKLKTDFSIQLPIPPDDWEESSLLQYLSEVEDIVQPKEWQVRNECWLGLFSFHKLVMYQDLHSHGQLISANAIVSALSGNSLSLANDTSDAIPAPEKLDQLVSPADSYLVVDADSSQLACIEAVKRGTSLVLQGPPGTGKSQTITNLIAESIARGKTVLFVSEKMAALEVVYKRLQKAHLGHFCLELHSHKANKREVVEELYNCYLESLQPTTFMTAEEMQRLTKRREQLNDYVRSLHQPHDPLKKSVFNVLGELAQLDHIPFISSGDLAIDKITPQFLDEGTQLARRLANVWTVVEEGSEFPWYQCKTKSYGIETRATFQSILNSCIEYYECLQKTIEHLSETFGTPRSVSLTDAKWLLQINTILRDGPGVEESWITAPELDPLIKEAEAYSSISSRWHDIKTLLDTSYTDQFYSIPSTVRTELAHDFGKLALSISSTITNEPLFVAQRQRILKFAADLKDSLDDWIRDANITNNILALSFDQNISGIHKLLRVASLCQSTSRPDKSWLTPAALDYVANFIPGLEADHHQREALRAKLFDQYYESFLELDLEELTRQFVDSYSSPLRWLKPGFYKQRSLIRQHRRNGKHSADPLNDLRLARDAQRLEARLQNGAEKAKLILATHYREYETDFTRIKEATAVARELLAVTGGIVSDTTADQVVNEKLPSPDLVAASDRLKHSIITWEQDVSNFSSLLSLDRLPTTRLPFDQSNFKDIRDWVNAILPPLDRAVKHINTVMATRLSQTEKSVNELLADLDQLLTLHELQSQLDHESERLRTVYGHRYLGFDTDWHDVLSAIDWTNRLREHFRKREIPRQVLEIARIGSAKAPLPEGLSVAIEGFESSLSKLADQFELPTHSTCDQDTRSCSSPHHMPRRDFPRIAIALAKLRERIDELRDWVDYNTTANDFHEVGLGKLVTELTANPSLKSQDLANIARRALLSAWITAIFQQDSALKQFRGQEHERLVDEFRQLDARHRDLASNTVIAKANQRKPQDTVLQPGGEAAILSREANKKRRHLPIRKLFAQIPNLLTRLKPCLLMSPLSVSQFLDPNQISFDLIVFDEASQIRSEDAVGAIYRGNQLVVCGDNKQLPPTAFFEQGMLDDFSDDENDENFDVFDSILDECSSIGLPRSLLRWHYRSRHESLIAFSNHRFYDSRLVTFPAAIRDHPDLGVKFVHVPDGIYDRGGRRDNQREAERVVELIVQHYLDHPQRSLGVIAFSRAQQDAIEDRLEHVVRSRPELENLFTDDRLEGFFVKNLESVQGDERDVIIFSVGYGKDAQGRFTMSFGPLNLTGGERRLNVAVTRAREQVTVVSSIRASDLDISATQAAGVLALYHYLDYAERGIDALAIDQTGSIGDFDSPFESNVAAAIRSLGYDAISQVGCSGFRIDLGVLDPAQPGRFILGVECDGATYHSSHTARDRDRLRQDVLQQLGWRIHRIWSPDWVARRDTEIQRLRSAIESSRNRPAKLPQKKVEATALIANPQHCPSVTRVEPSTVANPANNTHSWSTTYEITNLSHPIPEGIPFHHPSARSILVKMLWAVVAAEGPIHFDLASRRIADAWGLQRTGNRMVEALQAALNELVHSNLVATKNQFLSDPKTKLLKVRLPNIEDRTTIRKIDHISPEEMALAVTCIIQDAISIPNEQVITQTARIFGFDRTGTAIRDQISALIDQMIKKGTLLQKAERLSLAKHRYSN